MFLKISRIIVIAALVAGSSMTLAAATTQTAEAAMPGTTIVYNIFATDGYIKLADGTTIYDYGFVGGRSTGFTFQNSFAPLGDGSNNTTFKGGIESPSAGRLSDSEKILQGNAQLPGPLIYASVGDVVEINFKNLGVRNNVAPNDPHSIHLHALDVNAANDGVPETSVGATPANLCENPVDPTLPPVNADPGLNCDESNPPLTPLDGAGNVIVYMFAPKVAGTYFYHCHQEADIHVQMGMYGALVIYNSSDAGAKGGPGSGPGKLFGWKYDKDVVLLETEVDVRQHCSEEGTYTADGFCPNSNPIFVDANGNVLTNIPTLPGQTALQAGWNPVDYHPQYWLINGISFPNTIHVAGGPVVGDWPTWLASHPGYDPFITGSVSAKSTDGSKGQKVLIRMINMGFETQPMHMHGFHAKVIGADQRAWTWANTPGETIWGQGEEKNTLTVGSGEEYDLLINFGLQATTSVYPNGTGGINGTFDGGTETRYDPATGLPVSNTKDPNQYPAILSPDGNPYIGGPTVFGVESVPGLVTNQIFPFHNHDDYKATNNGTYPGGMFTAIMPTP